MAFDRLVLCFILLPFLASCSQLQRRGATDVNGGLQRDIRDESVLTVDSNNAPRKKILVLPFLDDSEVRPPTIRQKAEQAFVLELNRSGQVLSFDSSILKTDLNKFIKDRQYRMPELAKLASTLGIGAILEAKLLDIRIKRKGDTIGVVRNLTTEFEIQGQVRVMNVRRGKEVFNTIKTVTIQDANIRVAERVEADRFIESNQKFIEILVKDAFLDFVPQVITSLDQVEWAGRIAAINGDRLYLNVGKASGLMVGDLLKVMEDGDDVYDPESGSHIGRVQGRLKGTLEIISYFGTDGAIAVVHSGGGFKENDKVEMYQ